MDDDTLGNPWWRIGLWTLLVEVLGLGIVLLVPGFFLALLSDGCMSPGQSSPAEPQNFDPVLAIGGMSLTCVAVVAAVLALKFLFASERGEVARARWLRVQLTVQAVLATTLVVIMVLLANPDRLNVCYPGR